MIYLNELFLPIKQRELNRSKGLCGMCGKVYTGSRYYCEECSKKRNKYRKELRRVRTEINRCTRCGKVLTDKKYKTCEVCRTKEKEYRSKVTKKPRITNKTKTCKPKITVDYLIGILKRSVIKIGISNNTNFQKIFQNILQQYEIELELEGFKMKKDI